jgi:ribonuclease HI
MVKGFSVPGGWAAIVQPPSGHGKLYEGYAQQTNSTAMEIRAVVEGLRVVPDDACVEVQTDCETIRAFHAKWLRTTTATHDRLLKQQRSNLRAEWIALVGQFERFGHVEVFGVADRERHMQCHRAAGRMSAEARSRFLEDRPAMVRAQINGSASGVPVRMVAELQHDRACDATHCVVTCNVWKHYGGAWKHQNGSLRPGVA